MARRRGKVENFSLGITQILVLIIGAFVFLPQLRQTIIDIGLVILTTAVTLLLAAGIVRVIQNRHQPMDEEFNSVSLAVRSPCSHVRPQNTDPTRSTQEIIRQLRQIDWFQFEKVVAVTYRKLGYEVTRRGGANPDGGIDLLIKKNGQQSAVQCKQWKKWNVGVKAVRELLGAMSDAKVQKGVFVTLAGYTGDAKALAEKNAIEMLTETHLAKMLDAVDARYDPVVQAALQDPRKFCPKCEKEMVLRTAKKGAGAGGHFWGCSAYPKCRCTMKA